MDNLFNTYEESGSSDDGWAEFVQTALRAELANHPTDAIIPGAEEAPGTRQVNYPFAADHFTAAFPADHIADAFPVDPIATALPADSGSSGDEPSGKKRSPDGPQMCFWVMNPDETRVQPLAMRTCGEVCKSKSALRKHINAEHREKVGSKLICNWQACVFLEKPALQENSHKWLRHMDSCHLDCKHSLEVPEAL